MSELFFTKQSTNAYAHKKHLSKHLSIWSLFLFILFLFNNCLFCNWETITFSTVPSFFESLRSLPHFLLFFFLSRGWVTRCPGFILHFCESFCSGERERRSLLRRPRSQLIRCRREAAVLRCLDPQTRKSHVFRFLFSFLFFRVPGFRLTRSLPPLLATSRFRPQRRPLWKPEVRPPSISPLLESLSPAFRCTNHPLPRVDSVRWLVEGPVRSGDVHQSVLARVDSRLSTARVYYPEVIRLADRLGGFSSDLHHSFVRAGILAQINPTVGL